MKDLEVFWVSNVATNSTADIATFPIFKKYRVHMVAAVVNGSSDHATAFTIAFDKRPTAGSDTSRGDADCGQVSKTASTSQQGKMLYDFPSSVVTVDEGDQIIAQVTVANGEACAVDVGVVLEYIPDVVTNNTACVEAGA